jgi:putative transcriptional regulator
MSHGIIYHKGEGTMLKLRVLELLKEQEKTKYSLYKELGMSYQNFGRMINNQTKSIRYENIEAMCVFFGVTPNDLFEFDFELCEEPQTKKSRNP